jgi:hypothetical protein
MQVDMVLYLSDDDGFLALLVVSLKQKINGLQYNSFALPLFFFFSSSSSCFHTSLLVSRPCFPHAACPYRR